MRRDGGTGRQVDRLPLSRPRLVRAREQKERWRTRDLSIEGRTPGQNHSSAELARESTLYGDDTTTRMKECTRRGERGERKRGSGNFFLSSFVTFFIAAFVLTLPLVSSCALPNWVECIYYVALPNAVHAPTTTRGAGPAIFQSPWRGDAARQALGPNTRYDGRRRGSTPCKDGVAARVRNTRVRPDNDCATRG